VRIEPSEKIAPRIGSADQTDRGGGARTDDRPPGKGGAPPTFAHDGEHDEDGCGNGVPMETNERFPQGLGNLATNARFPHSHKPILSVSGKKEAPENGNKVLPMYPV
jgi:hypothetical protein